MKKYDNYKDSGIEWIGDVPSHWLVDKLNRIFQINTGFTPSTGNNEFYKNGVHDWITIRDLEGKYISESKTKLTDLAVKGKTIIPKGSLLYSFKLSVGQMAFTNKDIYTNEAIFSIFPNEKLNLNYYYYLLDRVLIHNSNENIYGAKILNQELIRASKLLIPSEEEQTSIANYLDHKTSQIDHLIAKKEQFIKLLEEERVAVINQAVTKGLDPNVPMKDSGIEWLGEIPVHWEVKRLKYCYRIFGGFAFSSSDFKEEGVQIVKIGNLYQNQLSLDRAPTFVDRKFMSSHSIFLARQGDILMSLTGTLGKRDYGYAILVKNEDDLLVNQRVALIKANEDMCIEFSINMFHSELYLNQLYKIPTGTKQGNLSCEDVLSISMAIPSKEEQIKIGEYLKQKSNEIDKIINKTQQEIEFLKEYKTALVSEVVSGKVDVRDEKLN